MSCKVICKICGYETLMPDGFEPDDHYKCRYCSGQDFKILDVRFTPCNFAS